MREILFRGKRQDNGKWVYGGITFDMYGGVYICPERFSDYDEELWVFSKTVGQYTGLTDENGTKIFDGDIVEIETEIGNREIKDFWKDVQVRQGYAYDYTVRIDQAIVQWNSIKGMWDLKVYNNGRYKRKAKLFVYRPNGCKVIGNIYDNIELLGQHKESKQ